MTSWLVDSNVLVYAYDLHEPEKQRRAIDVLEGLQPTRLARLSTQVLGEFFRVATRKLSAPLTMPEAAARVERFARAWVVLSITPSVAIQAAHGAVRHQLPYWDAQLWATAKLNQIPGVLSEDFEDGRTLEGVTFRNPFAPSFAMADLGVGPA